ENRTIKNRVHYFPPFPPPPKARPWQFRARIPSFQGVAADFPGDCSAARRATTRSLWAPGARNRSPTLASPAARGPGSERISGHGFNLINALRQVLRAIIERRSGGEEPSAFMLRSDAQRRVSKYAPADVDVRA